MNWQNEVSGPKRKQKQKKKQRERELIEGSEDTFFPAKRNKVKLYIKWCESLLCTMYKSIKIFLKSVQRFVNRVIFEIKWM